MKKLILLMVFVVLCFSQDLKEIKKTGELRHLGVPYAYFVTGLGDGLDVEVMQGFAKYIGVKYVYVKTNWDDMFKDLTGKDHKTGQKSTIRGDVIANGLTKLPWREKLVNYSTSTFPSGVWLIARAGSKIKPIKEGKNIQEDIVKTKKLLANQSLLTRSGTCLDASLYNLKQHKPNIIDFPKNKEIINMIPTLIDNKNLDFTLMDVEDALIALKKWQTQIKVIGPITPTQDMGAAFRKDSPQLLEAFNRYFKLIKENGTYKKLLLKYYPSVLVYYPDYFGIK